MANENKVVLKSTSKKTVEHFISHLQYLEKDNASVIYKPNAKASSEVCNMHLKNLGAKKGKRGRPPIIGKDLIFSIPKDLKEITDNMSDKELKSLFDVFMDTVFKGIKNQHPNADIKFLRKNMMVAYHRDSDDRHFHCTLPAFTKTTDIANMFNKTPKTIQIDYSKRIISANARKKMYYKFENMRGIKNIKEITTEEFIRLGLIEKKKNLTKSQNWAKRKKQIKLDEIEFNKQLESENKRLNALEDKIKSDRRHLTDEQIEWKRLSEQYISGLDLAKIRQKDVIEALKKKIGTFNSQIANNNTDRAKKTLDTIEAIVNKSEKETNLKINSTTKPII